MGCAYHAGWLTGQRGVVMSGRCGCGDVSGMMCTVFGREVCMWGCDVVGR